MNKAQTGFTCQYIGQVSGPGGVLASVTFAVAEALAEEIMDSGT